MKKICILLTAFIWIIPAGIYAQLDKLHGDEHYSYNGLHSGNQIRTTFYNDGMIGIRYASPDDQRGEWPINSGHLYINQLIMFVGAEVRDTEGNIKHIVSEGNGCTSGNSQNADSGDSGPSGEWWTFAPLPGFANDENQRIAMSHWTWSWPASWPDKFDDTVDPGWSGSWNGYFGKNILNADQESYYVMDDYLNQEFKFYPDSTDSLRRGLGLRVTVRGFQWSNVLVEDCLFFLYDVENIGTFKHDKMNFAHMSGPIMGCAANNCGDGSDDGGAFDLDADIGYHYDKDDIGSGGWTPVGLHGLAFFESPGDPYDGIDNDGDGKNGDGPIITQDFFKPKVYQVGDPVILIDYQTFKRTVTTMKPEGVSVTYQGREYTFLPNTPLEEITNNLIDDNLNGIIDENNGSTFGEGADQIVAYLYIGEKYINYFTGEGSTNALIDERRDDGIDNDGNWDVQTDDVGLDGVAKTGDLGENDGKPTSGAGTNLPGEPHIDKTDIHESDMIGLTAFNIYTPWTIYPLSEDEVLWEATYPGYLNAREKYFGDTDILLASGYFPLIPDQIERFSMGIMFGVDKDDLLRNKQYAQKTYNENYNFSKSPYVPTVEAVPGDGRVTLYWDDVAEKSLDPITGYDFEGYRIYRSTDPSWSDMIPITDAHGFVAMYKPLAQFDLDDDYQGYAPVHVNGVRFYLGNNTGLVHSYVDSTARNGQKYYYAVTSYDRGDGVLGIAPTECSKYISINQDGTVDKGKNVAIVRPDAPSAGFVPATFDTLKLLPPGTATGKVHYQIIDPTIMQDGHTYQISFEDTIETNSTTLGTFFSPYTKTVTLNDVTSSPVLTLINRLPVTDAIMPLPLKDGFILSLTNATSLEIDTTKSGWNRPGIYGIVFMPYNYTSTKPLGIPKPCDYRIEIYETADVDSSTKFNVTASKAFPAIPVNFKVINLTTGQPMDFAFYERDGSDGRFTAFTGRVLYDQIIFLEKDAENSFIPSWGLRFDTATNDSLHQNPQGGDILTIRTLKPFLSHDVFEFKTFTPKINDKQAKSELNKIKVVPNPYVVTNSWEPLNPYTNGRGPRELHFNHLPSRCSIKIFNIRGQLVAEMEHNTPDLADGTEIWDMQSKDNLDISYGVYVYYVDAGSLGQITGKFAIIK